MQRRSRYEQCSIFFKKPKYFQKKGLGRVCAPIWHISKFLIAGSLVKNSEISDFGPTLKSVPAGSFLDKYDGLSCLRKLFLIIKVDYEKMIFWAHLSPNGPKWGICRNFYPHFGGCGHVPDTCTYFIRCGGVD